MKSNKAIGKKLKELRVCTGYNQKSVGGFLGVDQSLICKIENGERSITTDMLDKLTSLFGVTASDIVNDRATVKPLSCAFRGSELSVGDMETISAINKIALNSEFMSTLLKEGSENDR